MLLVQTGVKHAVETGAEAYRVSVATTELTADLFCLETAAVAAADLLCAVLVAVLVVSCLTSGTGSLFTVELLSEAAAGLLSMVDAALTDGLTDVAFTVVTAVVIPLVLA